MIRLFTNFYIDVNRERMAEFAHCIQKNFWCNSISEVYFISEGDIEPPSHPKAQSMRMENRPTYRDYFKLINSIVSESDISIIANLDIYFDHTIEMVKDMNPLHVYALSRWDEMPNGTVIHFDKRYSQDSFIFKGKVKVPEHCDFTQGLLGSENRLVHELYKVGYAACNPSRDIRSYHLHNSGVRNYTAATKVEPPYKWLEVIDLPVPE